MNIVLFPKSQEEYLRTRHGALLELSAHPGVVFKVWAGLVGLMNKQNRVYGESKMLMQECGVTNKMQWHRAKRALMSIDNPFMVQCKGYLFICPYDATKTNAREVIALQEQWHRILDKNIDVAIKNTFEAIDNHIHEP